MRTVSLTEFRNRVSVILTEVEGGEQHVYIGVEDLIGGGIAVLGGSPLIAHVRIEDNQAGSGSGCVNQFDAAEAIAGYVVVDYKQRFVRLFQILFEFR